MFRCDIMSLEEITTHGIGFYIKEIRKCIEILETLKRKTNRNSSGRIGFNLDDVVSMTEDHMVVERMNEIEKGVSSFDSQRMSEEIAFLKKTLLSYQKDVKKWQAIVEK